MRSYPAYSAFSGVHLVASGPLDRVLLAAAASVREAGAEQGGRAPPMILFFEDATGRQVDMNLHGTPEELLARELPPAPEAADDASDEGHRARGRPKLGVVSREVTLLPRHWAWLETQRGGASAALRRLVEEASRQDEGAARLRQTREAVGRVMGALAGDLPGFEEASRALYAGDEPRFLALIAPWPEDVAGWLARRLTGA